MITLYLVRHAIAQERDHARWPQDSLRPLTADGERRFRKAARGLASILPRNTVVLTSPFTRARQTADLLTSVARLPSATDFAPLGAEQPIDKVFDALAPMKEQDLVLVGHEPSLGKLLMAALAGSEARFSVEFRKGGAACVSFRGKAIPGRGTLIWHLTPKLLRAMR